MPSEQQNIQQALDALISRFPKHYGIRSLVYLKAMVEAIAVGDGMVETLIEQVASNLYTVTAQGKYLDAAASRYNVTRGRNAGIGDADFQRMVPIAGAAPKQIYSTLERFLDVAYGPYLTAANFTSGVAEPYALSAGMQLKLKVDASQEIMIPFASGDAANLAAATAAELATAITSKTDGRVVGSVVFDHALGANFLSIRTSTVGNQGFLQIRGGDAQVVFKFGKERVVTPGSTEWTVTRFDTADEMQFEVTGGVDPDLQASGLAAGDRVIIPTGSGFDTNNVGTFEVTYADATTFRLLNWRGQPEVVTTADAPFFYRPDVRNVLVARQKAAIIEASPKKLTVVLPVTSPVVHRNQQTATYMKGAASLVLAADSTTLTLQTTESFLSAGSLRPASSLRYAESAVSSIAATTITLVDASAFPTAGAVYCAPLREYFYYSGKSGNTLQNVTPTPGAAIIGGSARFTDRFKYTSKVGNVLQGVFPSPAALAGRDVIQLAPSDPVTVGLGSYLFDAAADTTLLAANSTLGGLIPQGAFLSNLSVTDASDFPDQGYIVLEPGTTNEEGPLQYLSKLNDQTLVLNPSTPFSKTHLAGAVVRAARRGGYPAAGVRPPYPVYLTSSAPTTDVIRQLLADLVASNVIVEFVIVVPELKWPVPNDLFGSSPN